MSKAFGIHAEHLSKVFMKNDLPFHALSDVSFSLNAQTITGLIGLNGAGKTTLLRLLCSVFQASSGMITINSCSQADFHQKFPQQMTLLSSDTQVYQRLSIREFLKFYAKILQINKADFQTILDKYIDLFALSGDYDQLLENCSTGTKQKTAFLSVIMKKPLFLFLDEPFSNVDLLVVEQMIQELRLLKEEGSTIIISGHNLYEIESLCDHILMLMRGSLIINDSYANLKSANPDLLLKDILIQAVNQYGKVFYPEVSEVQEETAFYD